MCTVESEHSAVVCDVAIDRVRQELAQRFPSGVTYTLVEGQGTRIQADPTVDGQQFTQVVQRAITDAQNAERR
jgi:hypothetical protein